MYYVEYINTFDEFVNEYTCPPININPIMFFKNALGNIQIVTTG